MPYIMGFVKMCERKEFAEDFQNGILHANKISYFGENGNDLLDGVILISPHVHDLKISCNGINLDTLSEDMCGPAELRSNHIQNLNVFCMNAIHTGDFESIGSENIHAYRKHLEIDERCFDMFGEYAVIVHNTNEFLKRVDVAIRRDGLRSLRSLISYFDPNNQPVISINSYNAAFYKRDQFHYEREYRIAIDTGRSGKTPLRLNIGDISDITSRCKSREFNKTIEVRLPTVR